MWPEWHHKMKLLFNWKEYRDGKLVVRIYDQMNLTLLSAGLLSVCLEKWVCWQIILNTLVI
jgi:hypothetical protein